MVFLWYCCSRKSAFWIPGTCLCSVCTVLLLHTKNPSGTNFGPVVHHKQDIDLHIGTTAFHLWFLHLDCSHKWTCIGPLLPQQSIPAPPGALHSHMDGKVLFLDAGAHLLISRTRHRSPDWDGGHRRHPETAEDGTA